MNFPNLNNGKRVSIVHEARIVARCGRSADLLGEVNSQSGQSAGEGDRDEDQDT